MTQNQNIRFKNQILMKKMNFFLNEVIRVFMGHPKPLAFKIFEKFGHDPSAQ